MSHFESPNTTPENTAGPMSGDGAEPVMMQAGSMLADAAERIEGDARLDQVADALDGVAKPLSEGAAGSALRGEWLGHALHPLLTDFPLGCWLSSGLLDLIGGRSSRTASQRLVGLGLLFSAPTVAAGLAEYPSIEDRRLRRVAAAHAAGNGLVAFLYLRSWVSRRRGHHLMGILWGMAGGLGAWVTGYLGGHLSMGRSVGTGLRGAHGQGSMRSTGTPEAPDHAGDGHEELIDLAQASEMLHVPPEQVRAMVDQGVLVAAGGSSEPVFHPEDVRSVGLLGG
jgi:uncharacterized membrane protein